MLSLIIASLIGIGSCQFQTFGAYYYPSGDSQNDETFLIFGGWNSTHIFFSLTVTGDQWFGMAFAQSMGCTPANIDTCSIFNQDAWIFYSKAPNPPENPLDVKECRMGNDWLTCNEHAKQDLELLDEIRTYSFGNGVFQYSLYFARPYNPTAYGDRSGYALPYPLAGDFCWLWAMGDGLLYPNNVVDQQGYQCIEFGGTTAAPTPSPSYGPTMRPTVDPTLKPTNSPTEPGATARPSVSPTMRPTLDPTDATPEPTDNPTKSPTPSPTVQANSPSASPTKKPTPSPSLQPTLAPTPEPSKPPTRPGETPDPTGDVCYPCTLFANLRMNGMYDMIYDI